MMTNYSLVAFLAATLVAQAPVAPQKIAVDGATAHVYKTVGGIELRLHVFRPPDVPASVARPAVLFFFGGGWNAGTVEQFVPQAKHLAERGMVAAVVDYRVFSRHNTSPFEAIADTKSAIRWVRSQAAALGIDPNRIAAAGGSAGGHLALSAGVLDAFDEPGEDRQTSSRPNALILFNPAVDTTHETPPVLKQRFGGRGQDGSPIHHLRAGLPPTVIFHGKADAVVPYADVERFCAESRKLGNECLVFGYEGAGHGFFNAGRDDGKWYRETLAEMDRFLTKIGYLPAQSQPSS